MSNPLEAYLSQLHGRYQACGRAVLWKEPTPGEPKVGPGGRLLYRKARAVACDFSGWAITPQGVLPVQLEAKLSTSQGERVSFPLSRLERVQRMRLLQLANAGGIAALYLRRVEGLRGRDYLVRALAGEQVLFEGQKPRRKSIRWEDIAMCEIPPNRTWLDVWEART